MSAFTPTYTPTFVVLSKEDIQHSEGLRANFKDAECVVQFPARLRVAPCGCFVCEAMTPFGNVTLTRHICNQHARKK